jgi:hypothetical protein
MDLGMFYKAYILNVDEKRNCVAVCSSIFFITVVEISGRGEAFYMDGLETALHYFRNASPLGLNSAGLEEIKADRHTLVRWRMLLRSR